MGAKDDVAGPWLQKSRRATGIGSACAITTQPSGLGRLRGRLPTLLRDRLDWTHLVTDFTLVFALAATFTTFVVAAAGFALTDFTLVFALAATFTSFVEAADKGSPQVTACSGVEQSATLAATLSSAFFLNSNFL